MVNSSRRQSEKAAAHGEELVIKMWEERPVLWDVTHPEYKNYHMKEIARKEIAQAVDKTTKEIKDKLKSLNDSYVKARKKLTENGPMKPGMRDAYFLERLQFLLPSKVAIIESRTTGQQNGDSDKTAEETQIKVDEEEEPVIENPTSHQINLVVASEKATPRGRKRKSEEAVSSVSPSPGTSQGKRVRVKQSESSGRKTEEEAFADYVGVALKNLDPSARQWCMMEIHNALFNAKSGLWNQSA